MSKLTIIEKFAEKVREEENSFVLSDETNYYYFVQAKVGAARYVYGERGYKNPLFYSEIDRDLKLIAIVVDNVICIQYQYIFGLYSEDEKILPEGVSFLSTKNKEYNRYIQEVIFSKFYEELPDINAMNDSAPRWCEEDARKSLLFDGGALAKPEIDEMFSTQDTANVLCGFINLEEEALKRLKLEKDSWILRKRTYEIIKKMIADKKVCNEYELKIAEGLNNTDAKNVTIEFELNGRQASEKINPARILMTINNKSYFDKYDFATKVKGEKLLKTLDAGTYIGSDKEVLRGEHINRIKYGTKILYEKN